MNTNIVQIRETGFSRTGTLHATYDEIVKAVGEPNVTDIDDPDKVKASWGFGRQNNPGSKGFIWCYNYYGNVKYCKSWSADGDPELLTELFGSKFSVDNNEPSYNSYKSKNIS